jgi:hypothetical protein
MCTVALGVVNDTGWEGRLLVILSGVVTLLLSILLGGFVKHLAAHQDYNQALEQRLFAVLAKTDDKLDETQTRRQCEVVQRFLTAQIGALESKIDTVLKHHSHGGSE